MINVADSINTKTFEVEIITPTHIGGAGENHWQKGIDFVVKDNKTWVLDLKKLCTKIPVDQVTKAFSRSDNRTSMENLLIDINIESVSSKYFDYQSSGADIKRHIFNGFDGKPYIPGSSIKGAFASILLSYFIKQNKLVVQDKDPSATILGNFENSVMRFLQFTDVQFDETFLINSKIFNLENRSDDKVWKGGWKHRSETNQEFNYEFTTSYETIKPNEKSKMQLSFKKKAVERVYLESNKVGSKTKIPPTHTESWLTSKPLETICEIVNEHTLAFLEKEIAFFENYDFDANTASALQVLKNLKDTILQLDSEKECMLRLAAGSGFHSITGDWQYVDYFEKIGVWTKDDAIKRLCKTKDIGKQKYKSRKLAFAKDELGKIIFQPMGFIKLSMIDVVDRQENKIVELPKTAVFKPSIEPTEIKKMSTKIDNSVLKKISKKR